MLNTPYPTIQTERLILRRFKKSDSDIITYLRTDKVVNKYIDRPKSKAIEVGLDFIAKIDAGIESNSLYSWAITEGDRDIMIGSICLWNISEDRLTAEVGYDLSPIHHNKGIMNESLVAVIQFGMEEMELNTIEAFTHRDNVASKRLLEKNGFRLESERKDEGNVNNVVYVLQKK